MAAITRFRTFQRKTSVHDIDGDELSLTPRVFRGSGYSAQWRGMVRASPFLLDVNPAAPAILGGQDREHDLGQRDRLQVRYERIAMSSITLNQAVGQTQVQALVQLQVRDYKC